MVWHNTYSSGLLSYTNGSHEGFVEFCVIEVFKFWVILRWMKEGCKSLILGMPRHPNLLSKNEQPTKLGYAPEWHPPFFQQLLVFYLELCFYIISTVFQISYGKNSSKNHRAIKISTQRKENIMCQKQKSL